MLDTAHTTPDQMAAPPFCEFPREEFENRYARLRTQMYSHGLEALLATCEPNYRYLTGARNQRWPNVLRPHAVLLPLVGDPVVLQPATDNWGLHEVTWIKDLRGYGGFRIHDGYGAHLNDMIVDVLAEKGIRRGRVGIERGWQMRAGFSIDDFLALEKRLAPLELVDAAPIWWDVRMMKSPLEIDCIRTAAKITSASYRALRNDIKVGITESEIERRMCAHLLLNGAERPTYIPVNCHSGRWPRENHLILGLSTERKLENDSVVDMDGGCTYKGYWSDFSRMFGVGKPPAKAIAGYRVAQAAIAAGIEAVKPGNPISDVYRAMAGAFAKANSRDQVSETGMSETGLNGHGLGLSSTERPYVNINDTTIMAPGLYFCVEPIFSIEGYGMVFGEEMVVVTETGSEILSERAEPELPIVG